MKKLTKIVLIIFLSLSSVASTALAHGYGNRNTGNNAELPKKSKIANNAKKNANVKAETQNNKDSNTRY